MYICNCAIIYTEFLPLEKKGANPYEQQKREKEPTIQHCQSSWEHQTNFTLSSVMNMTV